jgi:hypothetical protein
VSSTLGDTRASHASASSSDGQIFKGPLVPRSHEYAVATPRSRVTAFIRPHHGDRKWQNGAEIRPPRPPAPPGKHARLGDMQQVTLSGVWLVIAATSVACGAGSSASSQADGGASGVGGQTSGGASAGGSGAGGSSTGGSSSGGSSGGILIDDLGKPCPSAGCPPGLTRVSFCGIAGCDQGSFCSCEVPCEEDADCPDGTVCASISDGPGNVCVRRSCTEGGVCGSALCCGNCGSQTCGGQCFDGPTCPDGSMRL